ncbi:Asp23/Gls24 family envelope stress response protein [Saccharopolyspora gloriosae]|uniref:Asp23/Gls24 family envelope stress response protein n=1 Tax=Saccharopolyspora gloriosae TaxID=455344 RepID=UPI001FB5E968|nr:Asp23/Gls24 family envelope stress response protein [Saccharopolyspora gloriosae]
MAQTSGTSTPSTESQSGATSGGGKGLATGGSGSGTTPARLADDTSQGKTTIAANVVQKIAGIAAREISGVHAMGGGVSRAFGAIRERIPGGGGSSSSTTSGVQVEVGEKQAAIDLDIVVEYGASIVELARAVRRNVITGVERMTGLEVIEVNIAVNDIHLPSEDDEDSGNGNGGQNAGASSRVE